MLTIEKVDTNSKAQVNRFVRIPFRLYKNQPCWVPPLFIDAEMQLNRKKHPFYEHSDADFFIASRDGRDVARLAVLENRPFNKYHQTHQVSFYLFECEDDDEAATGIFGRAIEWAKERGLDRMVGPKGFSSALDGYGMLVEGFDKRQLMSMTNYNYAYYPRMMEAMGFEKEVDFICCYLNADEFKLPERVHSIAKRVQERGTLRVHRFQNKSELKVWANRIGKAYNQAFINNWEYYPLSDKEIAFILSNLLTVADPHLIKIITHNEDVVGFLLGFPDLSGGLQRAHGKLLPFGLINILLDMKRTKWIALNGAGILPEFQGRGGNALMYSEMVNTVRDYNFQHALLTQVAETAVNMRHDLENLGGKPYINHRVYHKNI